ncbi:MAG: hypothetical protein HKL81_07950 [Acidimicrobiaceae bacterium]|nr:hypothetical protein [Acidimicrobiaceae bacterium]
MNLTALTDWTSGSAFRVDRHCFHRTLTTNCSGINESVAVDDVASFIWLISVVADKTGPGHS